MEAKFTVEDFKRLLSGEVKDDELATALFNTIAGLSVKERFVLARELLKELSLRYEPTATQPQISHTQAAIFNFLIRSFEVYTDISREECASLLTGDNLYGIAISLIKNDSFPIDFLTEASWLEKYANHPRYGFLKECVRGRRNGRKSEVIAYYRKLVPDSEHMTDKMVLSVAGVIF